jgi:hypothetical protein
MDSNEDREMDFDDHHEFMDQDIPAGQFPTADPGPIHQFLSGIPDGNHGMNINQEDLDLALESLPIPLKGPTPPGISLQEAIQVNQRHTIHIRQHQNIIFHSNRYTILYTDIVHYIGITLLISYTISDTISCTMFDVSI